MWRKIHTFEMMNHIFNIKISWIIHHDTFTLWCLLLLLLIHLLFHHQQQHQHLWLWLSDAGKLSVDYIFIGMWCVCQMNSIFLVLPFVIYVCVCVCIVTRNCQSPWIANARFLWKWCGADDDNVCHARGLISHPSSFYKLNGMEEWHVEWGD